MARGDQLGRQWKIIQILVSSNRGKSAAELADGLDCHPRTLYRDLEALQVSGFPIYTDRVDGKNLWSLLDTVKHQIPVPFSLTELMALYFSGTCSRFSRIPPFMILWRPFSRRLKQPFSGIYQISGNVENTLHVGVKPYKEYGKFKGILNQVNDAAVNRKSIEIVYFTMSRKKESRRRVNPYRIWFFNGTFYLIGFCHTRNEVRIFALDRIKDASSDKRNFRDPRGFQS